MKRQIFLVGIIVGAIFSLSYLYFKRSESLKTEINESKQIELPSKKAHQLPPEARLKIINRISKVDEGKSSRKAPNETNEEIEDYYERIENAWQREVRELIITELTLDQSSFEKYEKLRADFYLVRSELDKELLQSISSSLLKGEERELYEEDMRSKVQNRISSDFKREMTKLLGPHGFLRYKELRKDFNDQLKQELNVDYTMMIIEF